MKEQLFTVNAPAAHTATPLVSLSNLLLSILTTESTDKKTSGSLTVKL